MAHLSKYERPNNERAVIWTLNFLAIELNFLLSLCFFGGGRWGGEWKSNRYHHQNECGDLNVD